jgi:hypothetical protein
VTDGIGLGISRSLARTFSDRYVAITSRPRWRAVLPPLELRNKSAHGAQVQFIERNPPV